jgi:hypothetical protein
LDGKPFYLQGVSFFNALFNKSFNESPEIRISWLQKFKQYGCNTVRIWCQWDFDPAVCHFIDVDKEHTMYTPAGAVKEEDFERLASLIKEADSLDMVLEIALFANEKAPNLPVWALEHAAVEMTKRLMPYRNIILQIWNENSTEPIKLYEDIKKIDLLRIVTSSAGRESYHLGTDSENSTMDVLTPHTSRNKNAPYYKLAPMQIAYFLEKYKKPVIDDEPARNGTLKFGGMDGTVPQEHIEQIKQVRAVGGYSIYHHDMFQMGYGDPSIPPNGIPDPEFSPYHKQVFEFLRDNKTW